MSRKQPTPLIDDSNCKEILDQALLVAPVENHERLKLASIKAVSCSRLHGKAQDEILTETEEQFRFWSKVNSCPLTGTFYDYTRKRDELFGQEDDLRRSAARHLAAQGMKFTGQDIANLPELQDAIEGSAPSEEAIRVKLGVPPSDVEPPIWMTGLAEASPAVFSFLTANGICQVLSHKSILDSMFNPLTPIFALGGMVITVPILNSAQRFGARLAAANFGNSFKESLKELASISGSAIAVAVPAAGLTGLDVIAVMSLSNQASSGNELFRPYLPLVAMSFTVSAVIAKVHQGFHQARAAGYKEKVAAAQEEFVKNLRLSVAKPVELIAEADSKAGELAVVRDQLTSLEEQLKALGFTPEIPEEMLEAADRTEADWHAASEEFWTLAHRRRSLFAFIGQALKSVKVGRSARA